MPQVDRPSLRAVLARSTSLAGRFLWSANSSVSIQDVLHGSCLGRPVEELRGRSVLVTADQFTAALALIELDGLARRVVLCPADLPIDHIPFIVRSLPVDAIVSDLTDPTPRDFGVELFVTCSPEVARANYPHTEPYRTEWILLTSGTTGRPKMVVHTLASLSGAIAKDDTQPGSSVWSTFYDIRRYGGLQIFLRAMISDASLVLSTPHESTTEFLIRAGERGVTHISGTPSHWRKALISSAAARIRPQYLRLSGEIADQSILDNLRAVYPGASIAHAFASTEAGVAFDVCDGFAGFPLSLIEQGNGEVEMKVVDGSLRIRSPRNAHRYIGQDALPLADPDGFVDTGDVLELHRGRYYFVGRSDGVINVGGLKVHPEEVESVINRHQDVRMSLVKMRRNPITGALVVADVVLRTDENGQEAKLEEEILQLCRAALPRHKVPAAISFRPDLPVSATGKMVRRRA